jgi:hypothetical protein
VGVEKRKMARPRGPHPLNYLRVLYVLLGRRVYWDLRELRAWRAGEIITPKLSFGEIVEATGLSRGIVAKILRDALMRGVVSVNYDGRRSAYFLTQPGFFVARPYQLIIRDDVAEGASMAEAYAFYDWWFRGRPNAYEYFEELHDESIKDEFFKTHNCLMLFAFLIERCRQLKICDLSFYPEGYIRRTALEKSPYSTSEIMRIMVKSFKKFSRRIKLIGRGKPSINHMIKIVGLFYTPSTPEDEIAYRVGEAFLERVVCPRCFSKKKLYKLERRHGGYFCSGCGSRFKRRPRSMSKILKQFDLWCIGRLKRERREIVFGGRRLVIEVPPDIADMHERVDCRAA